MNKRKVPAEWVESSEKTLGIKQLKSFGSEQLNEGDIDQLLCGIDFDDALETDGSEKCKRVDEKSAVVEANRDGYLDLSSWTRCVIETVEQEQKTHDLIITGIECGKSHPDLIQEYSKKFLCRLMGVWSRCRITAGTTLSIKAVWNAEKNSYCITNTDGFVVVNPDMLISGTTVVGGLFCMRKAILSDRFTGIDFNNKMMTIGSIVHELFQIALQRQLKTAEEISMVIEEILMTQQMAFTLYASQMTSTEAREEMNKFSNKILEFMQTHFAGSMAVKSDKGRIDSIQDIEENIWVPHLGLKGKVDASVSVLQSNKKTKIIPLELKTGKASFSFEHTGQLIIYQMMMSEVGAPVDTGLLLYLRDGVMREISGNHNDRRDLIQLRNDMVYYLSANKGIRNKEIESNNGCSDGDIDMAPILLPEPINHPRACGNCPYNVLCSMYLKQDHAMWSSLSSTHPLREMSPLVTTHLTESHVAYFCHWVGLLTLEQRESQKCNQISTLWTETPHMRQKKRRAIMNLCLDSNVIQESDSLFLNKFRQDVGDSNMNLTRVGISVGDYLIVSTMKRLNIAAGRVHSIQSNEIVMALERNLFKRYANNTFVLDKYESQNMANFNMANMGALLNDTESSERLRSIIVDKTAANFSNQLPKIIATKGKPLLQQLNEIQRKAVLKALTTNNYMLLKGLPGTGKTQTLTTIIRLLSMMGKSVLVTSHTHSAIDNVFVRLLKEDPEIKFLRLGSKSRVRSEIHSFCESELTKNCRTPEEIEQIYKQYNIVGVTCLGAAHPLLAQREFDICLVDESTQVFQPTVLRPLLFAKTFVLVGDPEQLPPIVRSLEARKLGADESLFSRLDSPTATFTLTMQYRMNRTITKLANKLTYKGAMLCANDTVAQAICKPMLTIRDRVTSAKWLERITSSHIEQSVCFLNTGDVYERCIELMASLRSDDPLIEGACFVKGETLDEMLTDNNSRHIKTRLYSNYCEAAVIVQIIETLIKEGMDGSAIGVIAPYALQVELLKRILYKTKHFAVEVNTVDQYQGRDKEVIIYSCTKTGPSARHSNSAKVEILDDQRRLTVAITRAKHKLILIGDARALECYTPFRCLLDGMSGMNKINLVDGYHGFSWSNIICHLRATLRQGCN